MRVPAVRRSALALVPALALSTLLLSPAASARPADRAEAACLTLPAVVQGQGQGISPETASWDPSRQQFLIGSIRHGTVSVVGADGVPHTLVDDPNLVATGDVEADVPRNRLLVTYDDVYDGPGALLSDRSTPQTVGRHAGLGIYDLRTGALQRRVDLGTGPGFHLANAIAVDPAGNVYVTDSFNGTIYKVTPDGQASTFLQSPVLDAGSDADGIPYVGLNGIQYHAGGYLLVARYDIGAIYRVPLDRPEEFTRVSLPEPVTGSDNITLDGHDHLFVQTNTIRSSGVDGVFELASDDDWHSARLVRKQLWDGAAPTSMAVTPAGNYVLNSNLDVIFHTGGGQVADGFTLRRFPF